LALILNIETATTVCSVALAKDGNLISYKEQNEGYTHAENLTVFIEEVISKSGYAFKDIDAVSVSKGPGSYTGLRIGVSTAKGLCYALDKPLIALNTLLHTTLPVIASLKSNILNLTSLFCPMIDARRMEVYCSLFDSNLNELYPTSAEIVDDFFLNKLVSPLGGVRGGIVFFGDGTAKCKDVLSKNENVVFIDNVFPSAKNMITLSDHAFANKQFEDVAYFEPFYLKDFVAGKKKE